MAKKRSKSPKYQAAKVKRTRAKEKKDDAKARITTLKGKIDSGKLSAARLIKVRDRLKKAKTRRKKAGAQMKSQAAVMKDPYAKTTKKKVVKKKVVKKKVTKKKIITKKVDDRRVDDRRLPDDQYGGRVGEYQVPNRSFNWQTDPTEQALMASAMGRPDLAQMMLTGQYGPLAGQQYQYGGGQTRINYGAGGAGAGLDGTGGTDGLLGPLGDTTADTGTGDTRPFHERYMAGETAFGGHEGILKRLADADAAKEASRLESLNAASQAARGGLGRGSDPRLYDQRSPLYQGNVTAAAAADQARENAFRLGGMSNQITSGSPAARAAMAASAANPMDFAGPAQAAMTASRANPYDFSAGPMWQQTGPTVSGFNPLGGAPSGAGQAAMAAAAANPMDFSPWGTPAARQAFDPIGN